MSGAVSAIVAGSMLEAAIGTFAATLVTGGAMGAGMGALSSAVTGGDIGKGALWGGLGGVASAGVSSGLGAAGWKGSSVLGGAAKGALSGAAGSAVSSRGDPDSVLTGALMGGAAGGANSAMQGGSAFSGPQVEGSTGVGSSTSQYATDTATLDNDPLSGVLSRASNLGGVEAPSAFDKATAALGIGTGSSGSAASGLSNSLSAFDTADLTGASAPWYQQAGDYITENPLKAATLGLTGVQTLSQMMEKPQEETSAPLSNVSVGNFNEPLEKYTRTSEYTPYAGDPYQYAFGPEYLQYTSQMQKMASGGQVTTKDRVSPLSMAAFSGDGQVYGDGGGQEDSVPAMLSQDEYVIPAEIVAALGDGSSRAGGKVLDNFVKNIRRHKTKHGAKSLAPKAKDPSSYLPKKKVV